MTGKWIPPNERSKFISAYQGSSIGMAILFPIFGLVITYTTWEWVYHLCGVLGILWYVMWQYFVYDSPSQHPRIDPDEKEYIEHALGDSIHEHTGVSFEIIARNIEHLQNKYFTEIRYSLDGYN